VSNQQLHIPQGTEAFYLEEAFVHRELLRRFEDRCSLWGYLPVQTPVFDFHDLYRGLDDDIATASYRLVDRDGDILVLRSDITLFLARQMGMIVEPKDLPVRVYYGDTILRHEDTNDFSKNEFFQVGAELIGLRGIEADAEALLLLLEVTEALGAGSSIVHVGNRALLRSVHPGEEFARSVAFRRWGEVREAASANGTSDERCEALDRLYRFIGDAAELRALIESLNGLTADERTAVNHVLSLYDELAALGFGDRVRIDLSEVGDRSYYTGVVFRVYDENADAPVASGGRYDNLLGRFGLDVPSVGFSIMLRRLQSRLEAENTPEPAATSVAEGSSFRDRYRNATAKRNSGKVVRL
jgi:ATP phosphoribosyltransferase regulatory subunit